MNAKSPQQFRFLQALAHGQVQPGVQRPQMPHVPGQFPPTAMPMASPAPNPMLIAPHQIPIAHPLPIPHAQPIGQNDGIHTPFHLPYKDNLNQSPIMKFQKLQKRIK